jgi:hypothetical protein
LFRYAENPFPKVPTFNHELEEGDDALPLFEKRREM